MLNNKEFSKHNIATYLVFVIFLALLGAMGDQIVSNGGVGGRLDESYFDSFQAAWLLSFAKHLVINGAMCLLLAAVNRMYQRKHRKNKVLTPDDTTAASASDAPCCSKEHVKTDSGERVPACAQKIFLISFSVFIIAWLPYVLSCLPGGIFSDTFQSIGQALNMDDYGYHATNNHNPVLYTFLWRAAIVVSRKGGHEITHAAGLFLAVQYAIFAASMAYVIAWVYKRGISLILTFLLTAFVALFPLYPMWMVSLWKDTNYGLSLLFLTLLLGDLAFERGKNLLSDPKFLLKFYLAGMLTAFTRNNGKYVLYGVILLLTVLALRRNRRMPSEKRFNLRRPLICFFTLILSIEVIQGPLYDRLDFNLDRAEESLAVPFQQMAYLVCNDYELTDEELTYINNIYPIDSLKEYYTPMLFDTIKWSGSDFHIEFVEADPATFFRIYFRLLTRHPIGCLKAFALETCGFWAPGIKCGSGGDVNIRVWNNEYSVVNHDLFQQLTGLSLVDKISGWTTVRGGVYVYCMFYCLYLLVLNQDYRKTMILLPAMLNWMTILIATPIASSFRYINIMLLILPIEAMLICQSERNRG